MNIDPNLDLVLEKTLDVSVDKVWAAWTTPDLICKWFCPEPWKVTEAEIDLQPGGIFRTIMQSPEGDRYPNLGCILEVVPQKKLVWTDALHPGFRPAPKFESGAGLAFTAVIMMEPDGNKTKFTAIGRHATPEDKQKHEEMGFHEGWGLCADQLVNVMK
ncbi:SRPBCC family protein [Bdellovibrio sp. SKB1291214]|uniref:SRPBCC family protein n=1 Tax=Bdellovibrio sp. SKB1291214 TaxID=1732569 RepID=UPI000B5192E3|nr:SRPBCC family protein [Bdellovibrio sp. SKB1291214]UYL08540.1 SRPBCC family protein [Bdellovibrio sp. SKB1291214]